VIPAGARSAALDRAAGGLALDTATENVMAKLVEQRLQPKRLAREAIGALGLQPLMRRYWRPVWAPLVELTASCVFVHIPKTAGTSIANALGMWGISHSDAGEWRRHLGAKRYDARYRFSVVRHPIDRLVSGLLWQYALVREDQANFSRDYTKAADVNDIHRVNQLINNDLRALLADPTRTYEMQMLPRLLIDGQLSMHYIGKFEEIDVVMKEVGRHVPIKRDLPRLKEIGEKTKSAVVIEPDVFEQMCSKLQDEFKAFGYRPEQTKFAVAAPAR